MITPETPSQMDPDEFTRALEVLRWTNTVAGEELGCGERLVRRLKNGQRPVAPEPAAWLRELVRHRQQHPAPRNWWMDDPTDAKQQAR